MSIKVCKFSGNVLTSTEELKHLKKILNSDKKRKILVIAAPGKTETQDNMTDTLIECAQYFIKNKKLPETLIQQIEKRFNEIYNTTKVSKKSITKCIDDLTGRIRSYKGKNEKYLDTVKSAGEEYNARLISEYLQTEGVKCQYIDPKEAGIQVTPDFGDADIIEDSYDKLKLLRDRDSIIIIPGFFGYTKKGHIATFSRGGNDLTGSILSHAVDASVYENFIDYDGLTVVNPALVPKASLIREITYQELRELTYAGFKTFHEELLYPVMKKGIPMHLINFHDPSKPGTMIVTERDTKKASIIGIAYEKGFCTINIEKYMMNQEKGFARKLFEIIEKNRLSFDHSPSGIDSMSVVLKQDQLPLDKIRQICKQMYNELKADNVYFDYNHALISIVGPGLKKDDSSIALILDSLTKEDIYVKMIIKGGSEISIILSLDQDLAEKAIQLIYSKLFGSGGKAR
ncbi:MAG: aspartate kinase [Spirochaetes bacterium]|nr:aspartate kinase [Spirochaetota bacterium]